MTKEQKFYKALQDVFIGAKIEGQGGFVNLMSIKSKYYRNIEAVSYTHLRAHETPEHLVCRLLLEKKKVH